MFGRKNYESYLVPKFIGFDSLFADLEKAMNIESKIGFPSFNIKKADDSRYVIELAVAGFNKTDIDIELKDNQLVVSGKVEPDSETDYIYKGIAERAFKRAFTLADNIEVQSSELNNGILKIWLESLVKTQEAVKKISIK